MNQTLRIARASVHATRRHQHGAATVEYVVVTMLAVIVLLGSPNVIVEIVNAVKEMYAAFTFALGLTYPNPEDLLGG